MNQCDQWKHFISDQVLLGFVNKVEAQEIYGSPEAIRNENTEFYNFSLPRNVESYLSEFPSNRTLIRQYAIAMLWWQNYYKNLYAKYYPDLQCIAILSFPVYLGGNLHLVFDKEYSTSQIDFMLSRTESCRQIENRSLLQMFEIGNFSDLELGVSFVINNKKEHLFSVGEYWFWGNFSESWRNRLMQDKNARRPVQ